MALELCICGIRYDGARSEEVQRHTELHAEWEEGVLLPPHPSDQIVATLDGAEILLLTSASPLERRELAERVARRAMMDTPFHTPAYSTEDPDPDVRIFLARKAGRVVALVVLRPRPRWGWWSWDDYDAERRPATPVAPLTSWTVESIWTLPQFQQQGLGRRLLDVASKSVEQPIASFGWRRPFTPSGEAFVRRSCPEGFWVPD